MLLIIFIVSFIALLYALNNYYWINKQDSGNDKIKIISDLIHRGAMQFLNKEYEILLSFVLVIAIILAFTLGASSAFCFVIGAMLSGFAGNIGMRIATIANAKTTHAVQKDIKKGLKVAFSSGSVMGFCVVGLGLLGVTLIYHLIAPGNPAIIYCFGFGASTVALFARVGGGIYTKAADIGADLVGKIEAGIPEDDPRNPAVIADNVGDNVGDVAGMGADLFESYVDSIIAAMVIGFTLFGAKGLYLPLLLCAIGIMCSIVGSYFVRGENIYRALDKGIVASAVLLLISGYFIINYYFNIKLFFALLLGIIAALVIGFGTEWITSPRNAPTQAIAKSAEMGVGPNIITGISVGMASTAIPLLIICLTIGIADRVFGIYGIVIASVGMLSILGISLATDCYGPVADNAAGIAEMAGLGPAVRKRAEQLDEVGNSTAAIGKGFAIGSAALTTIALFVSYVQIAGLTVIDLAKPIVLIGLFVGGLLPFIFSALTMRAVGVAANDMVAEVRRQFKTGLLKGKVKPDYDSCIAISTHAALRGMTLPSLLALVIPILVGIILGKEAVGGLLAGSIVTGFLLAVFMANSGGAWDNAKKYIEDGHYGGKNSPAHKAAVVGDTVGDPFKDTAGPSLNILIKLMSIVALVMLPIFI